ncbi:MAG: hypothetical protein KA734_01220 [Fluviicola sp.]|nr:hypothetical protein [Fluviicola sp.]MBP6272772.1 hypothetical protein [Fluviicola sp.]
MKSTTAPIYQQHEENKTWINSLQFYKEDLVIFEKRLEEIAGKNSNKEVLAFVEHFQNQFIIQRNNIDEIAHTVNENEQALIKEINANPVAVDHRKVENHATEKDLVLSFEKNFNDLRSEYNRFSAKWM